MPFLWLLNKRRLYRDSLNQQRGERNAPFLPLWQALSLRVLIVAISLPTDGRLELTCIADREETLRLDEE